MSIDELPDELLLQIFNLFATEDLFLQLRLVSKRWQRLINDDSNYRRVKINQKLPSRVVTRMLQKSGKAIKRLYLVERSDINVLSQYLENCVNLESLTLRCCCGIGDNISTVLESCVRLHTIVIQHTSCIRNLPDFFYVLSKLPIRKVNLRNIELDTSSSDFSLLQNVKDMRLKSISIDYYSILYFCKNNVDTLTVLKLITVQDGTTKYPDGLSEKVFKSISDCRHLTTVCLGAEITAELNDAGMSYLSSLNFLITLVLHKANLVTSVGFANIFKSPVAKNLRKLGLYQCPAVKKDVLQMISDNCVNLEKFAIELCRQSKPNEDENEYELVTMAQSCTKLKTLYLFGMDIKTSESLHLLPEYLPLLTTLKYSNATEPLKIPSFLDILQKRMPNFVVNGLQWKFGLYVCCKLKV